jgi:hypothetical protein
VNCIGIKAEQMFKFKIINGEMGPSVLESPKSIMVNMETGVRPPKLNSLVKYYYSNCAVTGKIYENITIETQEPTGAWVATPIPVLNGEFDNSKLNISRVYRVKVIGVAPTNKTAQPVFIQLVTMIPKPIINPALIMFPTQISANQSIRINVPSVAVKCMNNLCSKVTFTCQVNGEPCKNTANTVIALAPTMDNLNHNLTIPASTFALDTVIVIGITVHDNMNQT